MAIVGNSYNSNVILGSAFLRNYLVTLDYESYEMTFAVSTNAVEGVTLTIDDTSDNDD